MHTEKNFITANAVEAILAVPKIQEPNGGPDYLRKEVSVLRVAKKRLRRRTIESVSF